MEIVEEEEENWLEDYDNEKNYVPKIKQLKPKKLQNIRLKGIFNDRNLIKAKKKLKLVLMRLYDLVLRKLFYAMQSEEEQEN